MRPTRKPIFVIATALSLLCACGSAWAFKLNPCLRVLVYNDGALEAKKIRDRNLCGLAPEKMRLTVHEHMTNFAIDEYRGSGFLVNAANKPAGDKSHQQVLNYMTDPVWAKSQGSPMHHTYMIIFGSWWNDDPLMYLWGSGSDFRHGLGNLRTLFKNSSARYEGGMGGCSVPKKDHLAWNSHFGRLQYLHFMSNADGNVNNGERLDETLQKSLAWIEFAYKVATGNTLPTAPLTAEQQFELGLPSIAENYCLRDPANTKIRTLFARPSGDDALRDQRTPDVALGSIFHILQDSFSPGHTCRTDQIVNGERYAVLSGVYNYNEQNQDLHSNQDIFPSWLHSYAESGKHIYANDPIKVGAWLLQAVDANTPWEEVRAHLLQTVFMTAVKAPPSVQASCIGQQTVSHDTDSPISIAATTEN